MANFMKKANKHPGALRRQAKAAGAIGKDGNIELGKMAKIAKKSGSTTLKRRVNLAKTYAKYRP